VELRTKSGVDCTKSLPEVATYGNMEFLQAMRDPTHEQHAAMWRWWGGPFDPNGFDMNAANIAIRHLK
jgi:hypothetical protein